MKVKKSPLTGKAVQGVFWGAVQGCSKCQKSKLWSETHSAVTRARYSSQGVASSPLCFSIAIRTVRPSTVPLYWDSQGKSGWHTLKPCLLETPTVTGEAATATRPPAS